jgi:hypothetical protein
VLVFRKLSQYGFFGIPLSTKTQKGSWYVSVTHQEKPITINLSQSRFFSTKRLYNKLGTLDDGDFSKTKQAFEDLFCRNSPVITDRNVGIPKYEPSITNEENVSNDKEFKPSD